MLGSLKKTIDNDYSLIIKFFDSQPEVYDLLDLMIISTRELMLKTVENLPDDERSFWKYMLWRTMYDYVEQSLLLIVKTRLDEGYALLRMAAELSRDIVRIADSQSNFEMWKQRKEMHNEDEYKKIFRFNRDDKVEKHVFKLYNLSSHYGVHSHQTRDFHLAHLGEVINDKFIAVTVPERAVLNALDLWLFSYFPLHMMAARTYKDIHSKIHPNPMNVFCQTELKILPILKNFRKNMKENYPVET